MPDVNAKKETAEEGERCTQYESRWIASPSKKVYEEHLFRCSQPKGHAGAHTAASNEEGHPTGAIKVGD